MALLARRVGLLATAAPFIPRTFVRGAARTPDVARPTAGRKVTQDEMKFLQSMMPTVDPGSATMPVIPMWVPGSLSQFSQPHMGTGYRRVSRWLAMRFQNWVASLQSVWTMWKFRGFPSEVTARSTSKALAAVTIGSTREQAWISPIRKAALDAYKELNTAIAARDTATVNRRSRGEFHALSLDRMPPKGRKFVWTLHSEVRPVQCLAWRAQAYIREQECVPGTNGFVVQALFRFDTMQSLREAGAKEPPAQERVTEYLVLEKRNWQTSWPWAVVAQGAPGRWVGDQTYLDELFANWAPKEKK